MPKEIIAFKSGTSPILDKMASNDPLSTLRISVVDMVQMRVRRRGTAGRPLPEYLYQRLPAGAISLMATIPYGDFAVSIPHQNGLGNGYGILKSQPPFADGCVVVYARRENGRYEAVNVRFRAETFDVGDFREVARRRVEEHAGELRTIPGRYAYFVPTVDLWGAVLRDNGYIAVNLPALPPDDIPELNGIGSESLGAGIMARAPLQAGEKQPPGAALPAFARVEVTLDPNTSRHRVWRSFSEYQKARLLRSRPPDSIVPLFHEWLSTLTAESGFAQWVFRSGMLFGDRVEWWGDRVRRRTEHEGIDFVEGSLPEEEINVVPQGTPVRAMADGEIVAVLNDFLGKTIVMRHEVADESGTVFYTFLSHIQTAAKPGNAAAGGQILGKIGVSKNVNTPAHLHLTGAWIPGTIRPAEICMDLINPAFTPVVLVDFNDHLQRSPWVRHAGEPDLRQR